MSEGGASSVEKGPARWLLSVGLKFLRVVPALTVTVVIATVISEASLLLAFLLPLKVIILVGSDHVPAYFPSFLAAYDKADLIPALALCAIGFYLLHQLGDRVATRTTTEGSAALMARSRKITLFENQDLAAERAFHRYAMMLANSVFVLLSLAIMWTLYPSIAMLLLVYGVIVITGGVAASRISRRVRAYLNRGPGSYAGSAADVGFLLSFSYMIFDYLGGSAPSVLVCIVGLILTRQALSRSAALAVGVHALLSKRLEISALFFHGQSMVMRPLQTGFWNMLQQPERDRWISKLFREVFGGGFEVRSSTYRQLGIKGAAGFVVEGRSLDSDEQLWKLVKVFNSPLHGQARHEATLLADPTLTSMPAPRLIAVDLIEGFQAHVFNWHAEKVAAVDGRIFDKLKIELAGVQPPETLADRFIRSRPMLWDRLDSDNTQRLWLAVADEADRRLVERFEKVVDALKARVKSTPLEFFNPGQSADSVAIDPKGRALSLNWGGWSLEPIGSGLLSAANSTESFRSLLATLAERRADLVSVTVPEIQLNAMVYEFAQNCGQQRYRAALDTLNLLLTHYDVSILGAEAA